ncbi:uncharacterized protein LOC136096142 [Hydra vulgaris]|uniref:uncharacterized protein LOC136096142 n=1 Tax=Hydra vulgaris TaxID=6087 RepID=UPI0032EA6E2C
MLQRNILLCDSLRLEVTDEKAQKYLDKHNNKKGIDLKELVLNETFWKKTDLIFKLLKPISEAILESESDAASVSIVPQVFFYVITEISDVLQNSTLFTLHQKEDIITCIKKREDFVVRPIHFAANLVDPRFVGQKLNHSEMLLAEQHVFRTAENETLATDIILDELISFKARSEIFSQDNRSYIWKLNEDCDPVTWWKAYAPTTLLNRIALILLSCNCSIASVERANKEFSLQKSKVRNRLTDTRASKLLFIAYNLKMQNKLAKRNSKKIKHSCLKTKNIDEKSQKNHSCLSIDNDDDDDYDDNEHDSEYSSEDSIDFHIP